MAYKAIRGMSDIVPPDVLLWQYVEAVTQDFFNKRSYGEIRTPLLEETDLFIRSIGEETDIVHKEMYTFNDRKGRNMSLRPEMTASVVRAVIENRLLVPDEVARFYYRGPMFRAERPQAGRRRQFHQIGVELFGTPEVYQDVEMIALIRDFLLKLGLTDDAFTVKVNFIGTKESREPYYTVLREYLKKHETALCDDCKRRLDTNILRVLDCKVEGCRSLCAKAPVITEHLGTEDAAHFSAIRQALDRLRIPYVVDPHMVRGLDYYTGLVFEVASAALGAQDALGAGGRYDGLVAACGGPDIGGIGFALGVERLLMVLAQSERFRNGLGCQPLVYVAHGNTAASRQEAFALYAHLASATGGVRVFIDTAKGSLKSQLRQANKQGAQAVVIIGDDELARGEVTIKNMTAGTQAAVKMSEAGDYLTKEITHCT